MKHIFYVTVGMVGLLMLPLSHVHAQQTNDTWGQAFTKFKNEQSVITRQTTDLGQQQRFVQAAVDVFIQHAITVRMTVQTHTDIFPLAQTTDLKERIQNNINALQGYYRAVTQTHTTAELRDLVVSITAHRALEGDAIRRDVLKFYVRYFQETTQKKVAARYTLMQEYITTLQKSGKDVGSVESVFAPAGDLITHSMDMMKSLLNTLDNQNAQLSLDDVETALQRTQKDIATVYSIFRKITFQENVINELNTEERGIQGTFPDGNI